MDLGTANSIVIHNDQVVVDEPSIVAVDRNNNRIIAVGKRAQMMAGKTDNKNIETVRPLRGGVIADFEFHASLAAHGHLHPLRHHQCRGTRRA